MPILKNCCMCCSLKTGTILTGLVSIAASIAAFIAITVSNVKTKTIILNNISPNIVTILIGINVLMIVIVSIFLVIGAIKRRIWFMIPWVVTEVIFFIAWIISDIYTVVEFFLNGKTLSGSLGILFGIAVLGESIYLWLVVVSYCQLVYEEKNRGPYGRPMVNID